MIEHMQFIRRDTFTYTAAGAPWNDPEWLSELLMAFAYRAASWSGVALVFAAASALTSFLLGRQLLKHLSALSAIVILQLALACIFSSISSRPYVLALPVLAAWTATLIAARDRNRAPSLFLLPLMTLWANLHGSFLLGVALVGPFAVEALISDDHDRWKTFGSWCAFGVGALVAATINPRGFGGLIFPLEFSTRSVVPFLGDWQSFSFDTISPFEVTLLALFGLFVLRPVRLSVPRALTLLFLVHMSLAHRRYVYVFAIIAAMTLAQPIAAALADDRSSPRTHGNRAECVSIAIVLIVSMVATFARLAVPNVMRDGFASPISALSHVPPQLASQPVLNQDIFGGYLIWRGVRPFIDTRDEIFSDTFHATYRATLRADAGVLQSILAKYRVQWTILRPAIPANVVLDASPEWRKLYADRYAVIHVRVPKQSH